MLALCWSWPRFRSCSASRESCLSGLDCGEPLPLFFVVCCVRAVPATTGASRRAALFRLSPRSPWWGVSLYRCSNLALPRRSLLPTPWVQCPSRVPAWCGVTLRLADGCCRELSAVVSHNGPLSSSWTGWNWPSAEPDGRFTDSGKGLLYCTQISPRRVSRLRRAGFYRAYFPQHPTPRNSHRRLYSGRWLGSGQV